MAVRDSLSPDQARRAVLRAQGLATATALTTATATALTTTTTATAPAATADRGPTRSALVAAVRRLGLLQVDSVNVLTRAHYLPLFSRLGPYDRADLDQLSHRAPRKLFEYWGHEASLIPVETQPLLRWRMAYGHAWAGPHRVAAQQPQLVADVLAAVAELGPISAASLERTLVGDHARTRDYSWGWNWSDVKRALEYLFGCGAVAAAGRDRTFTRLYDLTERVIPADILRLPTPDRADSIRRLVEGAARALAVAAGAELRDYWKLPAAEARTAVEQLVEAGVLHPVSVPGWPAAYLHRDAVIPRSDKGEGLLSPFDPLIWSRPRTKRIFGMRYRIEIYVPAAQRQFGYYALPYLHEGRLVARLDLKADRGTGCLVVQGGWSQQHVVGGSHPAPQAFAADLAATLAALADWLGLPHATVAGDGGDIPRALRRVGIPPFCR